jgi:hypothetical protein
MQDVLLPPRRAQSPARRQAHGNVRLQLPVCVRTAGSTCCTPRKGESSSLHIAYARIDHVLALPFHIRQVQMARATPIYVLHRRYAVPSQHASLPNSGRIEDTSAQWLHPCQQSVRSNATPEFTDAAWATDGNPNLYRGTPGAFMWVLRDEEKRILKHLETEYQDRKQRERTQNQPRPSTPGAS